MIAHNPLDGSGQAGFRHPTLAFGNDAHPAQRIRMTDGRQRTWAAGYFESALPWKASFANRIADIAVGHPE